MYKCARCNREFDDAYNITKYFNGGTSVQTVCRECIEKIGKVDSDGTSDNNSDMPDDSGTDPDREETIGEEDGKEEEGNN